LTFSKQDIISDNNGCLDFVSQCENNPIFDGITNSDTCNNGWKWAEGKYEGKIVADTCKKSCGKCGGMLHHFILNMFLIDMYLPKFSL